MGTDSRHGGSALTMTIGVDALRLAIRHERFVMHYQPQYCLDTDGIGGVESLVRMRAPDGGLIYPDEFIPVAESCGLIGALTNIIVRLVVRDYEILKAHGWHPLMGINISTRDLIAGDFIPKFLTALEETHCEADDFTFEITESTLVDDYAQSVGNVALLKSVGAEISIDDFGTGHASLKYIRHFPADEIKIDRQYVAGITSNVIDRTIVGFVIDLGHKLGCQIVAEGVEDEPTKNLLAGMGCDRIQGYWYARPMTVYRLVEFIHGHTH